MTVGATLALAALEAAGVAVVQPAGGRLRPLVDLLGASGLILGVAGALLVADRPFLAARAMRHLAASRGDASGGGGGGSGDEQSETGPQRRSRRRAGARILLAGAVLFALATILWAVRGAPGVGG